MSKYNRVEINIKNKTREEVSILADKSFDELNKKLKKNIKLAKRALIMCKDYGYKDGEEVMGSMWASLLSHLEEMQKPEFKILHNKNFLKQAGFNDDK